MQLLGLVWFLTILVFFSIPRSKIAGYIFPCLPAFAILAGPWLAVHAQRRLAAMIAAGVCLVAVLAALLGAFANR